MTNLEALPEQAATEIKTVLEELLRLDGELDMAVDDEEDASDEERTEADRLVAAVGAANNAYYAVLAKWDLKSNDPRVTAL